MLPQTGATEFIFLALIALIVVGPKDLPVLMRKVGQWVGKMRGLAAEFRSSFDELARQSELDELRKEVEALRNQQLSDPANIMHGIGGEYEPSLDPYKIIEEAQTTTVQATEPAPAEVPAPRRKARAAKAVEVPEPVAKPKRKAAVKAETGTAPPAKSRARRAVEAK